MLVCFTFSDLPQSQHSIRVQSMHLDCIWTWTGTLGAEFGTVWSFIGGLEGTRSAMVLKKSQQEPLQSAQRGFIFIVVSIAASLTFLVTVISQHDPLHSVQPLDFTKVSQTVTWYNKQKINARVWYYCRLFLIRILWSVKNIKSISYLLFLGKYQFLNGTGVHRSILLLYRNPKHLLSNTCLLYHRGI